MLLGVLDKWQSRFTSRISSTDRQRTSIRSGQPTTIQRLGTRYGDVEAVGVEEERGASGERLFCDIVARCNGPSRTRVCAAAAWRTCVPAINQRRTSR